VAKAIATIGGVGLAPGISKNRRLYTPEHIVGAVARAQKRLKDGTEPMVMLTHHAAGDDSREISGSLTAVSLDENGRLRFASDLPDTPAGWDIANLASTADGQPPFLRNVSIRGYWTGTVRTVKGPDGQPVETADGLIIDGLDFTRSPGVADAQIDTFAWTADGTRTETDERVPITESVQEARVTAITEETATEAAPQMTAEAREALRETLRALPPEPPVILRNGLCEASSAALPLSKRGSGLTGGSKVYADPGYQADGKQRYDLTTKALAKAAWSYVNQKDNAAKYTAAQLKRVKGRIMKALKAFGVKVAAEGWVIEPARQVTESELREWYGDYGSPQTSGSWSLNASNGPINLCLSCYGMDPADLDLILRAAADAACKALAALDPDMDGHRRGRRRLRGHRPRRRRRRDRAGRRPGQRGRGNRYPGTGTGRRRNHGKDGIRDAGDHRPRGRDHRPGRSRLHPGAARRDHRGCRKPGTGGVRRSAPGTCGRDRGRCTGG